MSPKLLLILASVTLYFITLQTFNSFSQGVAINTIGAAADPSAILDASSTNMGILIPRVPLASAADIATIASPATSLIIYNTATAGSSPNNVSPGFYYWNSAKWTPLGGSGNDWYTTGNTGSTASTSAIGVPVNNNFIGTTDAKDFVLASNNLERLRVASSGNIGIGTTTPNTSASLDVTSTTTGILIPRMSTIQRDAIASPAIGLQVFNIDCNTLNYYTGTCWLSTSKPINDPDAVTSSPATTDFCAGESRTFTVPSVTGATYYNWMVPAGATINSGQGTVSINVTFGNYSGNVCVKARNACETSNQTCLAVNTRPLADAPGSITGVTTVYPNQIGVTYSITGTGSYTWSVPSGVTITSGQGTNSIVVNFACNAVSSNISVAASNSCGTGSPSTLAVTVTSLIASAGSAIIGPGTIGGSPTASSGTSPYTYSWSPAMGLSNSAIANPTANACTATTYTVTVTDAHSCTTTSSAGVTPNLSVSAGSNVNTSTCPNSTPIGPAVGAGGAGGYTYSWSPAANLSNANIASPVPQQCVDATYTVTVTDANGCTATSSPINFSWGLASSPATLTLSYTGSIVNWTVPAGVTSVTIECWGAQGGGCNGNNLGGNGGYSKGTLTTTGGTVLNISVGGQGGWNGGGAGGASSAGSGGGTGGGASDVRVGGTSLADRIIVAGGGGSTGPFVTGTGGGVGGGGNGSSGAACWMGAGGAGGIGGAGPLGFGVAGASYPSCGGYGAGGGGGGYNGGGGGGQGGNTPCSACEPGCGGGGTNYTGSLTSPTTSNGVQAGNGQVVITY